MIPLWLQILLGIVAVVGPWISGYFGTQRGVAVGMATYGVRIQMLEQEVMSLRESRHEHSGFLTRHEMELEILRRKAGFV